MTSTLRSTPSVPRHDRLVFALDVESPDRARQYINLLGDAVSFYKIGLEMLGTGAYFDVARELAGRDKRVFADLKLFDVPETVGRAVRQLAHHGFDLLTVHGNDEMIRAAAAEKGSVKILAVTVLTSLDEHDLVAMGYRDMPVAGLVVSRARSALAAGADGVIASGREAPCLRAELGDHFLIVTPGIRPVGSVPDDQKRVTTVDTAFANGADHIVVGRPIRDAPDPKAAAQQIQATIEKIFSA